MGLFGTGNAGAALSLFLVPQLEKWQLPISTGAVYALLTALVLLFFYLYSPAMPALTQPKTVIRVPEWTPHQQQSLMSGLQLLKEGDCGVSHSTTILSLAASLRCCYGYRITICRLINSVHQMR